jgi:hypothetical protein
MDTKKFLKEIRSIIREEIEYALEKRLTDKKQKPVSETINHGINLYKQVSKKPSPKTTSSTGKMNSIQDLLNETRMSMQAAMDEDHGEYREMRFDSNSLNSFASMYDDRHIDATPAGVDPNEVAPEVHQALTRDYSALMAKINEKTGR